MTRLLPRARRGSVSSTVGLSLPVLVGFTAMAVDWGLVVIAKNQAQTAADAGALAAAVHFDDPVAALGAAETFVTEVSVNGHPTDLVRVEWGWWSGATFTPGAHQDANSVRVTASVAVNMPFTALFGIDHLVVSAEAGAGPNVVPGRAPDTVIVIDVTGSMSASELAAVKEGAADLVDCVAENSTSDSRAAIVLHTGVDAVHIDWTTYQDGGDALKSRLASINGCGRSGSPPCSGTNQSAGMGAALELLAIADPTRPPEVGQAVVLFSDGAPNPDDICRSGNYTSGSTRPWRPNVMAQSGLKGLSGLCNAGVTWGGLSVPPVSGSTPSQTHYAGWASYYRQAAEASDIDLHTVFYYDLSERGATTAEKTAGIAFLRSCTTNWGTPEAAEALVADDVDDISEQFEEICKSTTKGTPGLLF